MEACTGTANAAIPIKRPVASIAFRLTHMNSFSLALQDVLATVRLFCELGCRTQFRLRSRSLEASAYSASPHVIEAVSFRDASSAKRSRSQRPSPIATDARGLVMLTFCASLHHLGGSWGATSTQVNALCESLRTRAAHHHSWLSESG